MLFVKVAYFWFLVLLVLTEGDIIQNHLGIKTPYRYVSNINHISDNNLEGCDQKIWMLVRYGAINPNATHIQKMQEYLRTLQDIILEKNTDILTSKLLKSDIELFENWRPTVNEKDAKKLTTIGARDMVKLAKRMQARFPDVLPPVYSNTSYTFKFTKAQQTRRSAQFFAVGLFHNSQIVKDIDFPEAIKRDPILSFYKLCPKWESTVKNNYATYEERRKFENSVIMKRAVEKINNKLNLNNILSLDDVYLMYTTCAFETVLSKKRKSPWCVPFDLDTIKVIEYAEDLKYYWKDGYGYEITYKQACKPFNDMFTFINGENLEHKATLYFVHSEALLKMLAHLNLYRDGKPLRAADYDKNQDRKWRVSKIDTFGSNLAFISNRCNGKNKLLVLHNEVPVRLPSCPDSDLCDVEKVKEYYSRSILDCSFDTICQNNKIST